MKTQKNIFSKSQQRRYSRTEHGGQFSKGKRKLERPLAKKKWIHLVLKSSHARGEMSFRKTRNCQATESILKSTAKKNFVHIADLVNMGNHFHIKLKFQSRRLFQNFLRTACALIARHVTGARRGQPFGKFWDGLAYTRVLRTALEELYLRGYFEANRVEDTGTREEFSNQFKAWASSRKHAPS